MSDFGNSVDPIDDNAGNRIEGGSARGVLTYVAKNIVDDPEAVVVESGASNRGGVTLSLHVAPDDKGKVIGKRGRVAMALRTVVRAVGARDGENVNVDIADD